jgi:RNA polymerase sigma factor (sigma-70 family)
MSVEGPADPRDGAAGPAGDAEAATARHDAKAVVPRQRVRRPAAGGDAAPGGDGSREPDGPSDLELAQLIRAGDTEASEELYRRHAGHVRRYARGCCRDADTADDLTNEVFAATLQAMRGGAGPQSAVRAYLLTSVRRVAAAWAKTTKREHLVEDFAVFAVSSAGASASEDDTLDLGADVRAMHEAEQSMAVQAFRSLPERWQTVLWHTTVEESSPQEVAPLLGLTPNATAVLAHRAREGLKQAYLQAHVSQSLTAVGGCAQHADRLGAFARGGLRSRAERGLRQHLAECARCQAAALEVKDLNQHIRTVLPIAVIGWFAAGYSLKGAGVVAGAGGAAAAATGKAAGGSATSGSAAGGGAAAEGLGAPVKAGIAAAVAAAVIATALALALMGGATPEEPPLSDKPPAAAPAPDEPEPEPEPAPEPEPEPQQRAVKPDPDPDPEPEPEPPPPDPEPESEPEPDPEPEPEPAPEPEPEPEPAPQPPPAEAAYQVRSLPFGLLSDGDEPSVRTVGSSWTWQRQNPSIGGQSYSHGITVSTTSTVLIDLNRSCSVYRAKAGIDDLSEGLGGATFSVYGDGTPLWTSPVLNAGDPAVPLEVPMDGVRTLRLVVQPHGLLGSLALADWAESEIGCATD